MYIIKSLVSALIFSVGGIWVKSSGNSNTILLFRGPIFQYDPESEVLIKFACRQFLRSGKFSHQTADRVTLMVLWLPEKYIDLFVDREAGYNLS